MPDLPRLKLCAPFRRLSGLAIALILGACATAPEPAGELAATGWLTTVDGAHRLEPIEVERVDRDTGNSDDVVVDTSQRFQRFAGYGASITDASAWLLTHELDEAARRELLQELFGEEGALGLDATRITIGASDFSLRHYTYADTPGVPEADLTPARNELIPVLQQIRSINPHLTTIATPWSAPAWMKTSGSLIKGRLDPRHYGDFARYLVSYARQMRAAGVPIDYLTIQNEPHFEPANYPGMRVEPAERARIIGGYLGPLMQRELPDTGLLDWDHNWDEPESPLAALADPVAAPFITGVAWHCYGGDVAAQSLVHDRHPDKQTWFTECAAGDWSGSWAEAMQWTARNLVIGAPRNWAQGVIMWNLALDQNHGPHLGGCGNCRGLVTIDTASGTVTREPEYYAFAHGSRFLPENPVRIGTIVSAPDIDAVAFLGKQSGVVSLIVLNLRPGDEGIRFSVDGRDYRAMLPSGSLATFVIPSPADR